MRLPRGKYAMTSEPISRLSSSQVDFIEIQSKFRQGKEAKPMPGTKYN